VPFVRVSRDKRGYEHIYLFEISHRRPSKPRILYWFRTPPGVRVGREPFDEPVKRALEALNPGITFDWKKLASDTLPPPEVENWRERRRAEREAKRARRGDEPRTAAGAEEPEADGEAASEAIGAEAPAEAMPGDNRPNEAAAPVGGPSVPSQKPMAVRGPGETGPVGRSRRRRRGGRHRQSSHVPDVSVAPQVDGPGRSISSLSSLSETAGSNTAKAEANPPEEAKAGVDP
jgi:translation initiation factor IF-2